MDLWSVTSVQEINLSNIYNIFIVIFCRKSSTADTIRSVFHYARAIDKHDTVCFWNVCILNIVDDMILSNILGENSKATYARNIYVFKVKIKNKGALSLLVIISMDARVARSLSVTHPK